MISAHIFYASIPKLGNAENENEDAVELTRYPKDGSKLTELRCAIADGATQASFSKLWAHLLVRNAIQSGYVPSERRYRELLDKSCAEWAADIGEKELPWYAVEKAKRGAFSSFLWISITTRPTKEGGTLRAISVGDSELFIIRDEKLSRAFPIIRSDEFGSSPVLISSKPEKNIDLPYSKWETKWEPGDEIILATDAIAHYFLSQFEMDNNPLESNRSLLLNDCHQELQFRGWIDGLRKERKIKNDDTTMAWIHLYGQDELVPSMD